MARRGKKYRERVQKINKQNRYNFDEAIQRADDESFITKLVKD